MTFKQIGLDRVSVLSLLSLLSWWRNQIMPQKHSLFTWTLPNVFGIWTMRARVWNLFCVRSEVWITAPTMEQTPDAGRKTEQIRKRWNTENIHSHLIRESGRVRAHFSCWCERFGIKRFYVSIWAVLFELKVSLPIIIIIIHFLYQVQFPLFIVVIRSDVNKKRILWRTRCPLVLEGTKCLNL